MQHQIGVGTLGPVFLASDEVLHVTAAVKVFDVDATPDEIAALVQRLNATAARLSSHPGIIKLFEAGVANHLAYLATEHAEGMALDARLRERDAALPSESLGWLEAMAEAIDAIHADGVDHGSLHPRDVVLTLDGPRISGCGVARSVEEVGLRAPVRLPYTAPERAAGPSWGPAADVFSLAVIAFECLAGARPAGTGRVAARRLPPTVSPEYDRALVDVFARALSADAERRPASARAFVQGLLDAGAAYVYGGDAKRGAVHHRAGVGQRPAVKRAAARTGAGEGATEDGELARFTRDGVLPEAARPSRARRRTSVPGAESRAAEPSDASDPLTLFQPESDEPAEMRPADDAGSRGVTGKRTRSANGSPSPTIGETGGAADAAAPLPTAVDLDRAASGEETETTSDAHPLDAEGESRTEMMFAPGGLESVSARPADHELQPEGEPFDPAQGEEYEGATSADSAAAAEPPTSADARGESEGWLASTMAVPLVDAQEEVEYASPMADFAADQGADSPAPDGRFLDVDDPTGHGGQHEGPSELGGRVAGRSPEIAEGMTDAAGELTRSLEVEPNGRDVDWPLDDRASAAGTAPVGAATLFADDADEWDDEADRRRRRRFLLPLLLLLLAVAAGAWFYGAWTLPQNAILPAERTTDADAVSAPPSADETSDATAAGSSAPTESAEGAAVAPVPETPRGQSARQERPVDPRQAPEAPTPSTQPQAAPERSRGTRTSSAASGRGTTGADERPDRGRLLVRTSPSATVTVDGVPRGSSPVAVYALDWGAHTVVASRPGYEDVTRRVMIAPDSPAAAVTIDLREDTAGAATGSQGSTATAPAEPAAAPTEPTETTSGATGGIVTLTRPTGAQILVDGRSVGRTPATIPNVPSGSHTVRFELPGYRAWETRVTVEAGQQVRIAASLDRDR